MKIPVDFPVRGKIINMTYPNGDKSTFYEAAESVTQEIAGMSVFGQRIRVSASSIPYSSVTQRRNTSNFTLVAAFYHLSA